MGKLGLEPQILEEAELLMAHLEEVGVFDPNKTLANYTSNNVMRMVAGQRWQYGDPAYKEFIDAINIILDSLQVLMLEDLVPMFRYLPDLRKARKETAVATTHIRSLFRKIVEERMAEKDSVENEDFIQSYIKEHEEMEEDEVVKLIDLCQLAFIAGTETTNATLNFAIVHLLNNPSWQEELFQEVTAVLDGEVPSMAILEKLPKLEATIQETLRVNPNAPLTFRATSQLTKVRDYVVPANCMVLVNVYHINYDPEIFPNPSAFNPIRWLRPDGTFNRKIFIKSFPIPLFRRSCVFRSLFWNRETYMCWTTPCKVTDLTNASLLTTDNSSGRPETFETTTAVPQHVLYVRSPTYPICTICFLITGWNWCCSLLPLSKGTYPLTTPIGLFHPNIFNPKIRPDHAKIMLFS